MNFNQLIIDIDEGIKRSISSRKLNIVVTPQDFDSLVYNYLSYIKNYKCIEIEVSPIHSFKLIFLLRCYYKLWVEQYQNTLKIYKNFPSKFKVIKDVTKKDFGYIPKPFYKGQILYYINNSNSNCNRLRGVPLWDNLDQVKGTNIIPSVQINFNFISPIYNSST